MSKKTKEPLNIVYESNEGLINFTNDILDLSRIESNKKEYNFKLASTENLILEIIEKLQIKANEKKIYLKLEKPKNKIPLISIDRSSINEVIFNLVDNAIKYTNKGGITIGLAKTDEKVIISIKDTGEGMTKQEINTVFEKFTRGRSGVKKSIKGSGLGLYIAKKFTETHNGKIWAESKGKGKGSIFYIELPLKH